MTELSIQTNYCIIAIFRKFIVRRFTSTLKTLVHYGVNTKGDIKNTSF